MRTTEGTAAPPPVLIRDKRKKGVGSKKREPDAWADMRYADPETYKTDRTWPYTSSMRGVYYPRKDFSPGRLKGTDPLGWHVSQPWIYERSPISRALRNSQILRRFFNIGEWLAAPTSDYVAVPEQHSF